MSNEELIGNGTDSECFDDVDGNRHLGNDSSTSYSGNHMFGNDRYLEQDSNSFVNGNCLELTSVIPSENDEPTDVWKDVNPDAALDIVEQVCCPPNLDKSFFKMANICIPRNSYINRVFEMELPSSERVIAKFYRPNRWTRDMIQGEHVFLKACSDLGIPVIPPNFYKGETLFMLGNTYFTIFPKKGGRVVDELNEDLWKETGRLLGRVHNVAQTVSLDRMKWTPSNATSVHLKTILSSAALPEDYSLVFEKTVMDFIDKINNTFEMEPVQLIHGDCHFGNIIYRPGESLYLVDFDDCVIGHPVQDLWMLLPDKIKNCKLELKWFLEGYETFKPFSRSSLKLIPYLQIMRQIHFSAWCALQFKEDHFKHHFPEWGQVKYWNQLIKDIQESCRDGFLDSDEE
ncbi:serine/threonine protein kinase [bacterium]|jgi:Ser/Thr protein kinase RdoA (MazF antagonist)|nr:serine/threonine protein kinase [bacterium]